MTNFEYISKDINTLSNFIYHAMDCGPCPLKLKCKTELNGCMNTWRDWLNKEYKEGV